MYWTSTRCRRSSLPLDRVADPQPDHAIDVLLRRTQPVDRRDRRHHNRVTSGEQAVRGRVAQPLDLSLIAGSFSMYVSVCGMYASGW